MNIGILGIRNLIIESSCTLKHLVVLADLKLNILTVFCYVLEIWFWVVSNNLLCWLESCDADCKSQWLTLNLKIRMSFPCYKAVDAVSLWIVRRWKIHKNLQKTVCLAYFLLSLSCIIGICSVGSISRYVASCTGGCIHIVCVRITTKLPDWYSCQISKPSFTTACFLIHR